MHSVWTEATPQQTAAVQLANIGTAVTVPTLFGDERDAVIAKWNQLQAFWGAGKGYFTQQGQAVDFTPDNPFCLFKVSSVLLVDFVVREIKLSWVCEVRYVYVIDMCW